MKNLFLLLLLALSCSAYSQIQNHSFWTRDAFQLYWYDYAADASSSGFDQKYTRIYFRPEAGYIFGNRWMIGIVPDVDSRVTKYNVPSSESSTIEDKSVRFGAGPLLRYYIPLSPKIYLMPEFYLYYGTTNYTSVFSDAGNITTSESRVNTYGLGSNPSVVLFLNTHLSAVLTFTQIGYYKHDNDTQDLFVDINPTSWIWGIEYYFGKKEK